MGVLVFRWMCENIYKWIDIAVSKTPGVQVDECEVYWWMGVRVPGGLV